MSENDRAGEYQSRFRCPSCDHMVFNRRYPFCEGCGQSLPEQLLYSRERGHEYYDEIRSRLDRAPGSIHSTGVHMFGIPIGIPGDGDD